MRRCNHCGISEADSKVAGRTKCLKILPTGPVFESHSWKGNSSPVMERVDPADYGFARATPKADNPFLREDNPVPRGTQFQEILPPAYRPAQQAQTPVPAPARGGRVTHQTIINECAPIIRQMRREPRSYPGGHPSRPADLVRTGFRVDVGVNR